MRPPRLRLGDFPTPVTPIRGLTLPKGDLWVKDDAHTSALYGGNKVRKLEWVLADALVCGAQRILTMGAAGSHHVLATTLFARQAGLGAGAVLGPQPWTAHAEATLGCSLSNGLEAYPVSSWGEIPGALVRVHQPGDYWLLPGGSSRIGTLGYRAAVAELVQQIAEGAMPEPDWIVTALGTGGTVAGLVAGLAETALTTRVLGIDVAVGSPWLARQWTLKLAHSVTRKGVGWQSLAARLVVSSRELGPGYGHPTARGSEATRLGAAAGLHLDPTYTSKAFAGALELLGSPLPETPAQQLTPTSPRPAREAFRPATGQQPIKVLYWHTLSRASLTSLAQQGSRPKDMPGELQSLLRRS